MVRRVFSEFTATKTIQDITRLQDVLVDLDIGIQNVIGEGADLKIRSDEPLTISQQDLVLETIENFQDSDPDQKLPKIYDLVNGSTRQKHFHDINYKNELKSGSTLIPVRTVEKGEVKRVDWFLNIDENQQPVNLILKVEIDYTRDTTGFATFRITTRTWVNRDGSLNEETKVTPKYYFVNPSDMISEGYKRRKLLVQSIQIPTMTFMMQSLMPMGYSQESVVLKGREFMDDYELEFNRFVDNSSTITDPADPNIGKKSIVVQLEDNDPSGRNSKYNVWLDSAPAGLGGLKTIRQYLIEEFSI